MWKAFKDLLASKKVFLALLSAAVWGIGKLGLHLNTEELVPLVGPFWLALLGVAGQDWGKEAAKIAAGEAKPPVS